MKILDKNKLSKTDSNLLERSIQLPPTMTFSVAEKFINKMIALGLYCELAACEIDNNIMFIFKFETKEEAVEAKMKYL